MAQSARHLTLDFGSGHDLKVQEIEPCIGLCTDSTAQSLLGILFLSLSVPPTPLSLSKVNKL